MSFGSPQNRVWFSREQPLAWMLKQIILIIFLSQTLSTIWDRFFSNSFKYFKAKASRPESFLTKIISPIRKHKSSTSICVVKRAQSSYSSCSRHFKSLKTVLKPICSCIPGTRQIRGQIGKRLFLPFFLLFYSIRKSWPSF